MKRRLFLAILVVCLDLPLRAEPKYFGFFDCEEQCMAETHTYANVAVIPSYVGQPAKEVALIQRAHQLTMKVVIAYLPHYLRQPYAKTDKNDLASWNRWLDAVKPFTSDIAAFYPYDEPYWRGLNERSGNRIQHLDEGHKRQGMTEVAEQLRDANDRIKNNFPNTPIIYVEAYPLISEDLQIPRGYDWVGFDCYESFEDCHGKSIESYVDTIRTKLGPGQSLVVVPQGFVHIRSGDRVSDEQRHQLHELLDKYLSLVRNHPRTIAVLAWSYKDFPQKDGREYRGISALDAGTRAIFQSFGKSVLGR